MLKELNAITLQEPRKKLCLIFLCKVVEGLIPGIPATLLETLDLNAASLRNNSVIVKQIIRNLGIFFFFWQIEGEVTTYDNVCVLSV
jgi:hypothetical protein